MRSSPEEARARRNEHFAGRIGYCFGIIASGLVVDWAGASGDDLLSIGGTLLLFYMLWLVVWEGR